MKDFATIRETARNGIMSEYRLRLLVAQGKCPGIYAGNRFMVNIPLLEEQLRSASMLCGKVDGVGGAQ